MTTNIYPTLGAFTLVPAADLALLTAPINVQGTGRLGGSGLGKRAGKVVLGDPGSSAAYKMYVARGPLPADKWDLVDGSAEVTPV